MSPQEARTRIAQALEALLQSPEIVPLMAVANNQRPASDTVRIVGRREADTGAWECQVHF